MKTIFKYSLQALFGNANQDTIVTDKVIQFIHAAEQGEELCIWAAVDTSQPKEKHRFRLVVTGGEIPEGYIGYHGTVLMHNGQFVVHVFEMPL